MRIADCAPILLVDRTQPVVGAVHAGWRGTVQRAVQAGVDALVREFGSRPADLAAAVGPCLDVCCGEVGDEVVVGFRDAGHDESAIDRWFSIGPGGRFHLHLARANRDQLEAAGLAPEHIHVAGALYAVVSRGVPFVPRRRPERRPHGSPDQAHA